MSNNFKNNITSNIKPKEETPVLNTDTKDDTKVEEIETMKFEIGKKKDDKSEKKSFPLYVDAPKQKELDKVVKKTGYSRNELINMMIDFCLENIKYTD
jgi:hypothetical protein